MSQNPEIYDPLQVGESFSILVQEINQGDAHDVSVISIGKPVPAPYAIGLLHAAIQSIMDEDAYWIGGEDCEDSIETTTDGIPDMEN